MNSGDKALGFRALTGSYKPQGICPTKGITMPKRISVRAVYKNGSLTPLGHVDIEEGDVVSLTIEVEEKLSKEARIERSKSAAGAWRGKHDSEELKRKLRSPRLSTNEWLEKVRKRKEASQTRITADEILEARDADRT